MAKIVIHGLPSDVPRSHDPLQTELNATLGLYEEHGFTIPHDLSMSGLLVGAGKVFLPDELPPIQFMPNASPQTKQYFAREVQPELLRGIRAGEPRTMRLAYQIGRFIGAGVRNHRLMTIQPSINIQPQAIKVDGQHIAHQMEAGNVVEYGMGINGLVGHYRNVRNEQYNVLAIQHTIGEVTALRGLANYVGLNDQQCAITEQGIPRTVDALLTNGHGGDVDMVIASRVHGAGADLRYGIANSSALLGQEGLLIARGPVRYSKGMGYDDVLNQVRKDSQLSLMHNYQFTLSQPTGGTEINRLIVAQKV